MKINLLLLLGVFVLLIGCGNNLTGPSLKTSDVSNIMLKLTDVPSQVAYVRATLTRSNFDTMTVNLNVSSDSAAGSIPNIAVGTWHLQVNAMDSTFKVLYTGQTNVDVLPGIISNVNLTLSQSTGGINITVNWGPTNLGNAIYFDGKTGYIEVPNSPSLSSIDSSITIEAWIKPANQYYNTVVSKGLSNYTIELARGLYTGILLNGVNAVNVDSYWGRIMVPGELTANQWVHIAVTYSQSTGVKVYVNKDLVYQAQANGLINSGTLPLRIGARYSDIYTEFFKGAIDDVRIWNVVRTQNEIIQNMYKELSGNETGLVAYWKFDELPDAGNIVHDSSPNHNDGQIHGNVYFVNSSGQ